jgi:hypothetical protein
LTLSDYTMVRRQPHLQPTYSIWNLHRRHDDKEQVGPSESSLSIVPVEQALSNVKTLIVTQSRQLKLLIFWAPY